MDAMLAGAANIAKDHAQRTGVGPSAPLMANIQERLSDLRGRLGVASCDLDSLRTRLFGASPSQGDNAKMAPPPSHSTEAEIMGLLDDLTLIAMAINASANTLNNRI